MGDNGNGAGVDTVPNGGGGANANEATAGVFAAPYAVFEDCIRDRHVGVVANEVTAGEYRDYVSVYNDSKIAAESVGFEPRKVKAKGKTTAKQDHVEAV